MIHFLFKVAILTRPLWQLKKERKEIKLKEKTKKAKGKPCEEEAEKTRQEMKKAVRQESAKTEKENEKEIEEVKEKIEQSKRKKAILILVAVILVGIIFDIIGVAVTVANEHEFHAKATKKVKGSKDSIKLIRNAPRVANICADVIGDICGVLSGAISALIAVKITNQFGLDFDVQFLLSALVSALTVGGKALGKNVANNNSTRIVHAVGMVFNKFSRKNKKS